MKKHYLIATALLAVISNAALATTLKANVNGMVCAFCAQGIEKKLRSLNQTHDVYVNLKQRVVAIELQPGQTLSNETVKSLIKDAGYEVTSIETTEHSVAHIKADLESKQEVKQ